MLYAENELFGAELSAVGALSDRYAEVINVYKAMGGGWVDLADPLAPAAGAEPVPVASSSAQPDLSDRMASGQENGTFVLTVYRVRGIGGAVLKRPAQGWPQAVVVRLNGFPELEGFTAKSAGGTLQCALQRPEGQPPLRVCTLGSDRVAALRAEASMFEVTLPADMLRTDGGSIELRWVDQYR